jgi:pimeloyl-ACP methyl ester carboxylesterase
MMDPFHIDVAQDDLDDLNRRIAATRWPGELPDAGWSRGVPVGYLRELADYWRSGYDWRVHEARLNRHPQFTTEIDGATVHFLHVRSAEPDATPLLLTHGWPGTSAEFLDVIEPLTDPVRHGGAPGDAFHLVIPSIPGFGFSPHPGDAGWDTGRVARAWAELMRRLGYDRYLAQGGDWGSPISLRVGLADPDHVLGVHVNMLVTLPPPDPAALHGLSGQDLERLRFTGDFAQDGMGWMKIQSTRPQTLSYALTDSPVGQLAWITEKFKEWTDSEKTPEDAVSRDDILTNVTIFWLTATAGPSAQFYYESSHVEDDFVRTWAGPWPLEMPVGVACFPKDAVRPIRRFAEQILPTLGHWSEFSQGGHFPALEQPDLLVGDIRKFAAGLR